MTPQEAVEQLIHEGERLRCENAQLRGELAEARKQPVALLPEITSGIADEMHKDWLAASCRQSKADIYNIVLARHFREAAEARVKPTLDVEAVAKEISNRYHVHGFCTVREAAIHVLRDRCADTTNQPLQNMQQLPDETLAAAVARVERETRRECAAKLRPWRELSQKMDAVLDAMERGE